MVGLLLFILALIATVLAFTITVAETAFVYLPRTEAEEVAQEHPHSVFARVLTEASTGNDERYTHPLRLARVLTTGVATLAFMVAILSIVEHHWLAGLITLACVALVGYPLLTVLARALGRNRAVVMLKGLAAPVHFTAITLGWLSSFLDALVHKAAPQRVLDGPAGVFAEDELREFLDRASDAETIEDDEAQIVQSVFELDDTRIRSIMVPRTDMLTVEANESIENALSLFLRSGYSRMPVIGESNDDVLGILYLKDCMQAHLAYSRGDAPEPSIISLMREARFEPESKKVMDLLRQMQWESTHVAVVVDEYGGTAGMVTLEDLIEELVGDISDEYDNEKPEYSLQEDGSFKVSARLSIEDLGEIFGIDLDDEDVDTVGGLLAKHLGKVPIVGSEVTVEGITIRAIGSSGRRHQVDMLRVYRQESQPHLGEESNSPEGTGFNTPLDSSSSQQTFN